MEHGKGTLREPAEEQLGKEIITITCYACGRLTPATVATCLYCGAHHEVTDNRRTGPGARRRHADGEHTDSLIDLAEEIL